MNIVSISYLNEKKYIEASLKQSTDVGLYSQHLQQKDNVCDIFRNIPYIVVQALRCSTVIVPKIKKAAGNPVDRCWFLMPTLVSISFSEPMNATKLSFKSAFTMEWAGKYSTKPMKRHGRRLKLVHRMRGETSCRPSLRQIIAYCLNDDKIQAITSASES